jgi:uncharacterized membrane protein
MMAQIRKSIVVEAPVEKVHAIAQDPERWTSWLNGLGETERMSGDGGTGTMVEHSYVMAGARIPVTTEVLENSSGAEGALYRARAHGPLDGKHTWTYEPVDGGTRVTLEMQYKVPGAALGKIADRLIVERMQARSFEQSLENLKMLCEAGQAG